MVVRKSSVEIPCQECGKMVKEVTIVERKIVCEECVDTKYPYIKWGRKKKIEVIQEKLW